jgi:hypothetical protein
LFFFDPDDRPIAAAQEHVDKRRQYLEDVLRIQFASETLDLVTAYNGHWFHPRLNFFFGREDKLPVDQNLLISLIAPRILLHHYSIVERGLNPWANEQCFQSVKRYTDSWARKKTPGCLPVTANIL